MAVLQHFRCCRARPSSSPASGRSGACSLPPSAVALSRGTVWSRKNSEYGIARVPQRSAGAGLIDESPLSASPCTAWIANKNTGQRPATQGLGTSMTLSMTRSRIWPLRGPRTSGNVSPNAVATDVPVEPGNSLVAGLRQEGARCHSCRASTQGRIRKRPPRGCGWHWPANTGNRITFALTSAHKEKAR